MPTHFVRGSKSFLPRVAYQVLTVIVLIHDRAITYGSRIRFLLLLVLNEIAHLFSQVIDRFVELPVHAVGQARDQR